MIAPARVAALRVLQAVDTAGADLPSAIAHARTHLTDERDRALLIELTTGTLRWLGAIDHLIAHAARRPLTRIDPEVRDVLRLGIYQLLHLDRVPASAVVDDAVEMTRKAGKSSAAGFVNAVLRQVSRTRGALPLPRRPALADDGAPADREAALDYLSTTLSHPRWLVARWLDAHGFDAAERWVRFNNEPAPLTVRVNTLRTNRPAMAEALREHGVECRPTAVAPDGLVVTAGNPLHTPLAETGLFLLQDEASQAVALLALASPERTRAGHVRVARRQERRDRGGGRRRGHGSRGRHPQAENRSAAANVGTRPARIGWPWCRSTSPSRCLSGPSSTASSWMRPAPGSARSGASRKSDGGARPPSFRAWPRCSCACWGTRQERFGRVAGSYTRPVPARPRRTKAWWPRSCRARMGSPRSSERTLPCGYRGLCSRSSIRPDSSRSWPWQHDLEAFFAAVLVRRPNL